MPKRRKPANNRPPAVRKGGAHDAQARGVGFLRRRRANAATRVGGFRAKEGTEKSVAQGRTGADRKRILMELAGHLRAIPAMDPRRLHEAERLAGHCLAEALTHGAFARIKHLPLRSWVDDRIEKGWYGSAFGAAVNWLREHERHWPPVAAWQDFGSASTVKNGCPLLADAIEGEIMVPESERTLAPPVPDRLATAANPPPEDAFEAWLNRQRFPPMLSLASGQGRKGMEPEGNWPTMTKAEGNWPAVTEDELTILRTLLKTGRAMKQAELAVASKRSEKTVRKCLERLRAFGYSERAVGLSERRVELRRGESITQKGREFLTRNPTA